jgi:hypothetical protein
MEIRFIVAFFLQLMHSSSIVEFAATSWKMQTMKLHRDLHSAK